MVSWVTSIKTCSWLFLDVNAQGISSDCSTALKSGFTVNSFWYCDAATLENRRWCLQFPSLFISFHHQNQELRSDWRAHLTIRDLWRFRTSDKTQTKKYLLYLLIYSSNRISWSILRPTFFFWKCCRQFIFWPTEHVWTDAFRSI